MSMDLGLLVACGERHGAGDQKEGMFHRRLPQVDYAPIGLRFSPH
jgi:hypothetical protein